MIRNTELVKMILSMVEASEGSVQLVELYNKARAHVTLDSIVQHLRSLKDDELIEGDTFFDGATSGNVKGLTKKGHDYLISLKSEQSL
jgi:predicted transcriptional regulator